MTFAILKSARFSVHLRGPDLDEEAASLVGDLQDLGPGEAVDSELVLVDVKPAGTHP